MSIHSQKSFAVAQAKGAAAATTWARWNYLTQLSKRELAEIVCHLAALSTESYDNAISTDDLLIARIEEEREALAAQGMI